MDETQLRLQRMAASAKDPADREWARAKHQEMYGQAAAREEVPESLKPTVPLNPMEAALRRGKSPPPVEQGDGVLSQFNPIPLLQRADRAVEKLLPEGSRAFATKMFDTFTMGYGPKVSDALGTTDREQREAEHAASPRATAAGAGTGLGLSALAGPGRMAGEAVAAGVGRAAPALAGSLQARFGVPAVTGALTAGMDAEGMDKPSAIPERMAMGAAAGTAGQAAASAARPIVQGAARAGQAAVRRVSPWIRRAAEADEAGLMEGARALPRGKEGVQRASEQARDDILAEDEAMTAQARQDYRAGTEAALNRPLPMEPIRRRVLDVGVQSRPISSDRTDPTPIVQRGQRVLSDLRNNPTVGDALQVRRGLDEDAAFGAPAPTPEQLAARQVRGAVREAVRDASPAVAAADDQFANFRRGQERRNDILFSSEQGGRAASLSDEALEAMPAGMRQALRVGDEKKAAAVLERLGDDSVEALRMAPYLDELRAQHPAFGQALDRLMAKKSLEATRLFTLEPGPRTNLQNAVAQVPGVGGPMSMALQYGRGLGRTADRALSAADALDSPAMQQGMRGAPALNLNILDALMARRQEQR
jgi:hypothetical protein